MVITLIAIIYVNLAQVDAFNAQVVIFAQHALLVIHFLKILHKDNVFSVNPLVLHALAWQLIVLLVSVASQRGDGNVKIILTPDSHSLLQMLLQMC